MEHNKGLEQFIGSWAQSDALSKYNMLSEKQG
jgi:hypothetical protein